MLTRRFLIRLSPRVRFVVLLISLLFVSHCGNNKVEPTFTSIQKNVLGAGSSSCGQSACHELGGLRYQYIRLDMNVSAAAQYAAVMSTNIQNIQNPQCDGVPIFKAGSWDGSLFKAMVGSASDRDQFKTANGNCSPTRFTDMFGSLDDDTVAAIKTWVNAGALNN